MSNRKKKTTQPKKSDAEQKRKAAYVAAAQKHFAREGEREIDDDAKVSFGSDAGAYVQAWVWIPADSVKGENAS